MLIYKQTLGAYLEADIIGDIIPLAMNGKKKLSGAKDFHRGSSQEKSVMIQPLLRAHALMACSGKTDAMYKLINLM